MNPSDCTATHPFTARCHKLELPEYIDLKLRTWLAEASAEMSSSGSASLSSRSSHQRSLTNIPPTSNTQQQQTAVDSNRNDEHSSEISEENNEENVQMLSDSPADESSPSTSGTL